jgi:hypothetical protein
MMSVLVRKVQNPWDRNSARADWDSWAKLEVAVHRQNVFFLRAGSVLV